ncbi:SrfA family protein [Dickeya chrysanthemi]|uniref:SrfA family protein n=1 Tax=Dickeya chrysanthemi TaxID=556 RepID=UPI0030170A22
MAKLFLRSGNLDDFLALGENGQPVYTSALQLRETLRLRKQQPIADCLAIPQPNEDGDHIDWYSPFSGKITSWMAASDEQREQALTILEQYLNTIDAISERARQSDKPAQKLFGVLLSKAFQFPGSNHIYLVDDKPVITFWGFVSLGKKSRTDVLECLRPVEPVEIPEPVPEPLPEVTTQVADPEPEQPLLPAEPEPVVVEVAEPVSPPQAAPSPRRVWTSIWLWAPGAALLATLAFQIRGCVSHPDNSAPAAVTAIKPEKRVLSATPPTDPASQPNLPLNVATLLPQPVNAESQKKAEEKAPEAPAVIEMAAAPKGALVMPADAVKIGSIRFLDGNWQATVSVKNPLTGKPPVLRYQIKDGKGRVHFTYGEKVTCQAEVEAGLHQSGNLVINSRYRARCSDGSRYPMPEIVCTRQEASEAAECKGRYDADTLLPVTIKRESK